MQCWRTVHEQVELRCVSSEFLSIIKRQMVKRSASLQLPTYSSWWPLVQRWLVQLLEQLFEQFYRLRPLAGALINWCEAIPSRLHCSISFHSLTYLFHSHFVLVHLFEQLLPVRTMFGGHFLAQTEIELRHQSVFITLNVTVSTRRLK